MSRLTSFIPKLKGHPWRMALMGVLGVTLLGVGGLYLAAWVLPAPPMDDDEPSSSVVLDREGRVLHIGLNAHQQYHWAVPLSAISPALIEATLRYEDRYFYSHPGVNPVSLLRASAMSLMGRPIGASTLTMQWARLRLGLNTRTPLGKLKQIFWALRYEVHYTKAQILEAYLNRAPYGGNILGIEAASRLYLGKSAKDLGLSEAISLSVIPQNPVKRHPTQGKDFNDARFRALQLAIDEGRISERMKSALKPTSFPNHLTLPFEAPHFVRLVEARHPGSLMHSSLDLPLSQAVQKQMHQRLARLKGQGITNAAILVVDARTGEELVHLGSANFFDSAIQGEVDGLMAKRSPGSTLKPFIYGLALDQGKIHPLSLLLDEPSNFQGWQPQNADKRFLGAISATESLNLSRNIPAIALAQGLKPSLYETLEKGGVHFDQTENAYGLSLVLGAGEVTALELAQLYTSLENLGAVRALTELRVNPTSSKTEEKTNAARLFSPEASMLLREMLEATQVKVRTPGGHEIPLVYKTGTSSARRDAWCVGLVGPYVVVVWVGNFNGEPNLFLEGKPIAYPFFLSVAQQLAKTQRDLRHWHAPTLPLGAPSRLKRVLICPNTGDLAIDPQGIARCEHPVESHTILGVSPFMPSPYLEKIKVDSKTGKRLCEDTATNYRSTYQEVWPAHLLQRFRERGIIKPAPQDAKLACRKNTTKNEGNKQVLTIQNPRDGLEYSTADTHAPTATISLGAHAPFAAKTLYWFDGPQFLGSSLPQEELPVSLAPGKHTLSVEDDLGHRAHVRITIKRP